MKKRYRVKANSISGTKAYYRGHQFLALPIVGDGTRWVHADTGQSFYVSGLDDPKGVCFDRGADKLIAAVEQEPETKPFLVVPYEGGFFELPGDELAPIRIYKDGRVFDDIVAASRLLGHPFSGVNLRFAGYIDAAKLREASSSLADQ